MLGIIIAARNANLRYAHYRQLEIRSRDATENASVAPFPIHLSIDMSQFVLTPAHERPFREAISLADRTAAPFMCDDVVTSPPHQMRWGPKLTAQRPRHIAQWERRIFS